VRTTPESAWKRHLGAIQELTLTARTSIVRAVKGGAIVIVGGTTGIGLRLAETYAARGDGASAGAAVRSERCR
jgi:hypothetical protein